MGNREEDLYLERFISVGGTDHGIVSHAALSKSFNLSKMSFGCSRTIVKE